MIDPDQAVAIWNELIGAMPVPDPHKARELLLRVQGRERTAEMPETSLEAVTPPDDEFVSDEAAASLLPADEDPPEDLHDLLALFH